MAISVKSPIYNTYGKLVELIYEFTGASGDTGGTIQTPLKRILGVRLDGEKSDGSANLAAPTAGLTGTQGQVRFSYTDPVADHKGRVTVIGHY